MLIVFSFYINSNFKSYSNSRNQDMEKQSQLSNIGQLPPDLISGNRQQTLEFDEKPKIQQSEKKVVNQQDKLSVPILTRQKSKQQNQSLYTAAYSQRKSLNINSIRQYMDKRATSNLQRSKIFDLLRSKMYDKQKMSKKFIYSIIKYFQDYSNLLAYLHKSISNKLQLKIKNKSLDMLAAVRQSIQQLLQLNQDQCKNLQKFIDWLDKVLIQGFRSAHDFYKQRVKKQLKGLQKADYDYFDSFEKQHKLYQKISEGDDLLEKQLALIERIKQTDEAAINRGTTIYQSWENLLEQQKSLKKILKQNVLQFHQRYVSFHKKIQPTRNLHKYWSNLPLAPDIFAVFLSIFSEGQIQYICFDGKQPEKKVLPPQNTSLASSTALTISKQQKTQPIQKQQQKSKQIQQKLHKMHLNKLSTNFQSFLRLNKQQQLRIGSPYPYLQILVVKKFKSKVKRSHRQWKNIKLIFTIDRNLLFNDEQDGKCILKIVQSTIKLKRISENILQLSGVQLGFIIDSTRKQSVHFQTLDEVEQFIYFVDGLSQAKK